jgi:hypothetical protein
MTSDAMTWADWANLVANLTAVGVAVLGFALAIWQLVRAARAAEGAAAAAAQTKMLGLIQALRDVEHALDRAVETDNRDAAQRATRDWRQLAIEVHTSLSGQRLEDLELLERIRTSLRTASSTKAELMNETPIDSATEKLRTTISAICDDIGLLGGRLHASYDVESS